MLTFTAAMLDHAIGPNVIKAILEGMAEFMDRRGYASLNDFRGLRRDKIVAHSQIKRPDTVDYHGGYTEEHEGYAAPAAQATSVSS